MPEPQEARKAVIAPDREDQFGAVRLWLYAMAALVLAMIIVGGATRLTDSGLSITEWQPLLGAIPPLTEADWHDAFAKYKQIPQYQLVNKGMSLDEFKFIYWWEWAHRFLGRFIGIAFALPFIWLLARRAAAERMAPKLLGVLALGARAGRRRLVHGEVGPRGSRRRQPLPAGAPPDRCPSHPGLVGVVGPGP